MTRTIGVEFEKRPLDDIWPGARLNIESAYEIQPGETRIPLPFRGFFVKAAGAFLVPHVAEVVHPDSTLVIHYRFDIEANAVELAMEGLHGVSNREIQRRLPILTLLRGEQNAGGSAFFYEEDRRLYIVAAWDQAERQGQTQEEFVKSWGISARTLRNYIAEAERK